MPKPHPAGALPSNTSAEPKGKIGLFDYSQLPEKYKRKGPSPEEIEAIDVSLYLGYLIS